MTKLILASSSPRRAALLAQLGVDYEVCPADIDETILAGESPKDYALRVATEKANRIAANFTGRIVLAADTIVVKDQQILGKPRDKVDAKRMWRQLSGQWHEVITAVIIKGRLTRSSLQISKVQFKPISESMMDYYWLTGEPIDKAGGYAIQGEAAAWVIQLCGSYSGIMGLPLYETINLLKDNEIKVFM